MKRTIIGEFSGFGKEIRDSIKKQINVEVDDAIIEETIIGIEKATAALLRDGS